MIEDSSSSASGRQRVFRQLLQPDLRMLLQENDQQGLREFCDVLHPVVVSDVLIGLETREAWQVLRSCPVDRQAEIFEFIDPQLQTALVADVDRPHLSRLIEAMSPDDRVDLLEKLPDELVEALLPLMAQAERDEIRKLLSYPEDSVGSIMTTEYASLPEEITVREALDRLRKQAPERETIYYIYVLNDARRLDGVISLRQLILARPTAILADVMFRDPIVVHVNDDKTEAARQLARFDFLAIPVVDDQDRLAGLVTHDDVLDVIREQAEQEAYLQSAIQPLENSYLSTPLLTIAWKRGIWLMLLAILALGTARVSGLFDGITSDHRWLHHFLPLVLASGGNTGSQSATLVIRALALAPLGRRDAWRIIFREFVTGTLLGSALGIVVLGAVQFAFGYSLMESLVVGGTVLIVVTLGSTIGCTLPLIFEGLGMDPAVMSNPLIASVSDTLGVIIYFTTAILLLSYWA